LTRIFRADYGDLAYERFCAKRDRETKCKGGSRHSHPLNAKSFSHDVSSDPAACRQLDDRAWFEKFPRAFVRLRELRNEDGNSPAPRETLLLAVMKSGRRAFLYRWAGAETQ
jgi:hypothetical protein